MENIEKALMRIGRFVEKKGIDTILHALAKLRADGVDFRYTLVGDGKASFRDASSPVGVRDFAAYAREPVRGLRPW